MRGDTLTLARPPLQPSALRLRIHWKAFYATAWIRASPCLRTAWCMPASTRTASQVKGLPASSKSESRSIAARRSSCSRRRFEPLPRQLCSVETPKKSLSIAARILRPAPGRKKCRPPECSQYAFRIACSETLPHEVDISATASNQTVERLNAYWRATNYLSVGQIYLFATIGGVIHIRSRLP
jgi:hypothetical protein